MSVPVGSTQRIIGKFNDERTGEKIDPIGLHLAVVAPDDTFVVYTYPADIVRVSIGNYYMLVPILMPGPYRYAWWSDDGMATPDRLITADRSRVRETVEA